MLNFLKSCSLFRIAVRQYEHMDRSITAQIPAKTAEIEVAAWLAHSETLGTQEELGRGKALSIVAHVSYANARRWLAASRRGEQITAQKSSIARICKTFPQLDVERMAESVAGLDAKDLQDHIDQIS